ncbi:hypothetical protein [Archaeoglobus sp.]
MSGVNHFLRELCEHDPSVLTLNSKEETSSSSDGFKERKQDNNRITKGYREDILFLSYFYPFIILFKEISEG